MKLSVNRWIYAAALVLLGAACDDSEYDLQTLVPDDYHAVINVQDDTDLSERIYDTGRPETLTFTVLRGGSDPSIAIEAEAVPMTQKELSLIDEDYVLLPGGYYTLDGAIAIPAGEGADKITVSFSAEQLRAIRELNAGLEAPKSYCLALNLLSDNASVFGDKSRIVRRLDVMLQQLGFDEAGESERRLYDAKQELGFDIRILRGESDPEQAVEARIDPMTQEELAAEHPDYLLIPATQYTLSASEIALQPGESETTVGVLFSGEQISAVRELAEASGKRACLALKLTSETAEPVSGKDELLCVLDITQPILQLELVSGAAPHPFRPWWWDNQDNGVWYRTYPDYMTPCADCWSSTVTFRLKMPEGIANTWTIRCRPACDASLIEAYNDLEEIMSEDLYGGIRNWKKKKTCYDQLPSPDDLVFFDADGNRTEELTMAPGQNEILFSYKRNPSVFSFNGAGLYLCPVVVTTDLFPVDNAQYVLFEDEITLSDKTFWEPYPAGEGSLPDLYDGNRWGNKWQTPWNPGYCDKQYGQYFQINITSYPPSHGIHIAVWGNADNEWHWNETATPRAMKVFITSDNVPAPTGDRDADRAVYDALNWVEVGDLWCQAHSGQGWISPMIDLKGQTANAIRVCTYSRAGDSASYKRQDNLGDFNIVPYNSEVESVCKEQLYWNGWEDTYGNNISITEFKMWGN